MDEIEVVGGEYVFNGFQYSLKGHPEIEYGGKHYEPVLDTEGNIIAYKSVPNGPSKITVTLVDLKSLDIIDLQQTKNATVTLDKPNGKTFVMENACCGEPITESCEEGEVKVVFTAGKADEQNS